MKVCIERAAHQIAPEARLDEIYLLRTSRGPDAMATADVVRSYKRLTKVEHDFRALKTFNLQLRPIRHWNPRPGARPHLPVYAGALRALAPGANAGPAALP